MGFIKPAVRTEWVPFPVIEPKKPPEIFILTMENRPINPATRKMMWPMSNIDAVLSDMCGARVFAGIDCYYGYLQPPLADDC